MYTLHKSIIAFLLFFITTILACPPPQNENATQWAFAPDAISIQNTNHAGSGCLSVDVQLLPDYSAIQISFDPIPYVHVGPGLPDDEDSWECFVSFKLTWPLNWRPFFLSINYEVDRSLEEGVTSNQDTFYYVGPGPADHRLQIPNAGQSDGTVCVSDFLAPPIAGICWNTESSVGIRTKLTVENSGNLDGFGRLQVNGPYYLGLDWEFC
ncbi:hypothetical protein BDZ91DRAFT_827223 [Kalaharituber pfeilii]|nr:hypothetical protein BDZ91DRAFT_827223 [Kalaharituber pfeilii]